MKEGIDHGVHFETNVTAFVISAARHQPYDERMCGVIAEGCMGDLQRIPAKIEFGFMTEWWIIKQKTHKLLCWERNGCSHLEGIAFRKKRSLTGDQARRILPVKGVRSVVIR